MALANIYQIFYDQKTKQALDPAFIPLDNTANERPDWYEFWVIRNFLKTQTLEERRLYGFLSPSFRNKTGVRGADLLGFLGQLPAEIDVVLLSHGWDQIAYFKNVFEQGDYCHPGLLDASERFFRDCKSALDIRTLTGNSMNSVFSNYFLAKPAFWRAWLEMANCLWDICEHQTGVLSDTLRSSGRYLSGGQEAALKVFVQERIVCALLGEKKFNAINLDFGHVLPVNNRLFAEDLRTRKLLLACDTMKLEFDYGKDEKFNQAYWHCRRAVAFNDFFGRHDVLWNDA